MQAERVVQAVRVQNGAGAVLSGSQNRPLDGSSNYEWMPGMTSNVEFYVQAITADAAGRTVYVGFVVTGRAISVGDVFSSMYEVPRSLEDARQQRPRADPINVRSTSIRVDAIDSMRIRVKELPSGVTGALYLTGDDVGAIAARTFLSASR